MVGVGTYLGYRLGPRLRECCGQVEAEKVSNSRNKIHQTWERSYRDSLYTYLGYKLGPKLREFRLNLTFKFTQPRAHSFAHPCVLVIMPSL